MLNNFQYYSKSAVPNEDPPEFIAKERETSFGNKEGGYKIWQ